MHSHTLQGRISSIRHNSHTTRHNNRTHSLKDTHRTLLLKVTVLDTRRGWSRELQ